MYFYQICPAQAITIEAEEREDGSRRTTRWIIFLACDLFSFPHSSFLLSYLSNLSGMILTWPSASIVDFVKRHALLMLLLKGQTLNFLQRLMRLIFISFHDKLYNFTLLVDASNCFFAYCCYYFFINSYVFNWCRSYYMTKRSCLRMETDGKLKLLRTWDLKAFIADCSRVILGCCWFPRSEHW